jgi:very-short-patch-repair endonuclease
MGGESQLRALWGRVSAIAATQHGVISRRGLLRVGLTARQIERAVQMGRLHPLHRGVYAVGHTNLTIHGRWMAAVLAGGPTAALSHQAAASLHQLLDPPPSLPHITTAGKGKRRPGIVIHSSTLTRDERTKRQNIPTTTIPRTILDLAAHLDPFALERLLAEAHYRGFRNHRPLLTLIARHPGRRGLANLDTALSLGHYRLGRTESPLEDRFLRFLDTRHLERPELNPTLTIAGMRVRPDALWRRQQIVVECDGRDVHTRRRTFERDRVRDRRLLVAGFSPVRVTGEQLDTDADGLEGDLRALGVGDR